jgi:hypothetical protein
MTVDNDDDSNDHRLPRCLLRGTIAAGMPFQRIDRSTTRNLPGRQTESKYRHLNKSTGRELANRGTRPGVNCFLYTVSTFNSDLIW